jgi:hypothetical protein
MPDPIAGLVPRVLLEHILERVIAKEHDINNDPERPHIDFAAKALLHRHLRRQNFGRSSLHHRKILPISKLNALTEIADFDGHILMDFNIF